jgi:hypothetical protein
MTNKEYLTKTLNGLGISSDDIDIILLKADINGTATCASRDDMTNCDKAVYARMSIVLKSAMQNVTEGGYSISWNLDAVKAYYTALCNELGVDNVLFSRPRIRNKSNLW